MLILVNSLNQEAQQCSSTQRQFLHNSPQLSPILNAFSFQQSPTAVHFYASQIHRFPHLIPVSLYFTPKCLHIYITPASIIYPRTYSSMALPQAVTKSNICISRYLTRRFVAWPTPSFVAIVTTTHVHK